ncbi:MAG: ATP-binding protein [Dehalococcoidia bacterium]
MFNAARWRLTLWFAVVFAVILVVIGGAVFFSTRASLYDQVNEDLKVRNERLQSALIQQFGPFGGQSIDVRQFEFAARLLGAGGYSAAIVRPDGEQLQTSGFEEIVIPDYEVLVDETKDGPATITSTTSDGENVRMRVDPLGAGNFMTVARSVEPEQQALRRLVFFLIAGGVGGLVLAGVGGYWLSGRALRPIQRSMDAQRTFVADASHELRTPLSLIRANAEVIKRGSGAPDADKESLDDIISETDHLSYLVGQMLTLARADVRELPFVHQDVDLSRVAGDVVREARVLAEGKRISLAYENTEGIHVRGDEQRLRELLLILLDNSLKYTNEDGHVTVKVWRSDSRVRMSIADTGRGIPAADVPHVLDRFYRVDKARSREMGGTGLGLAIAKWITDAHGGTIDVESVEGAGTTVTVDLPSIDPA